MLTITNHGQLIEETNYWDSDLAAAGKLIASVNAGAIRLLLPAAHRPAINDMRAAKYVICSRGPRSEQGLAEAVELLFEDGSDNPYCLHLSASSFMPGPDSELPALPAEPPAGREWVLTVWDQKKGKPHKALERKCYWRRVPQIPWLKPWEEECN